jgi:hypothetical protein
MIQMTIGKAMAAVISLLKRIRYDEPESSASTNISTSAGSTPP